MSGQISLNPSPVMAGSMDLTSKSETINSHVNSCVVNDHSVIGLPQKKCIIPNYCLNYTEIKYVKDVSCRSCRSLEFCKSCHKCPNCCFRSSCRGQIAPVLEKMGSPGGKSQGGNSTQRRLQPPLLGQIQLGQVTNCHKQLCLTPQKPPPVGGLASAGEQKCSRTSSNSKITGVLQQAIFSTQTQQPVETYLGPEHLEHLPKYSNSKWRHQRQ